MFAVLVVVLIITLIWLEKFHGVKNHRYLKDWAGPTPLPFIGNAHQLAGTAVDSLKFINECWHKYGERVRMVVGSRVLLFLTDPKDVEVVMSSTELLDKGYDYNFLHVWLGQGLLTSTGEHWRRNRKFLTPAFHFSILRHFVPIFDERSDSFIKKMASYADGQPVDIYPLITRSTLDMLTETAMGTSTEEQTEKNIEYVQSVKQLSIIMNERMRSVLMRVDWLFRLLPRYKTFSHALAVVQEYTTSMIQQRARILEERHADLASLTNDDDIGSKKCVAFLDLLLLSELDGKKMDETAIKNEVDTFLFEGHDTTASGITFAIYMFAENGQVQEKCYEEQKRIFENDPNRPTVFRDLGEMKYLELALKEALRLYPSVPFVTRNVRRETQINDLKIPVDADVLVNIFNMNRNPKHFPDPLAFIPERFLPDEVSKRNPYCNVTFSAGPRNCIGQKFAMYEMKMTLSKLLRHYRFTKSNTPPLQLSCDIVLKSANGVHVCIHKR